MMQDGIGNLCDLIVIERKKEKPAIETELAFGEQKTRSSKKSTKLPQTKIIRKSPHNPHKPKSQKNISETDHSALAERNVGYIKTKFRNLSLESQSRYNYEPQMSHKQNRQETGILPEIEHCPRKES